MEKTERSRKTLLDSRALQTAGKQTKTSKALFVSPKQPASLYRSGFCSWKKPSTSRLLLLARLLKPLASLASGRPTCKEGKHDHEKQKQGPKGCNDGP